MNMNSEALLGEIRNYKNTNKAKTHNAAMKFLQLEPNYDALASTYKTLIDKLPYKGEYYNPKLEKGMRKIATKRKNGTQKKFRPGHFTME
jgi:hypothetical protein